MSNPVSRFFARPLLKYEKPAVMAVCGCVIVVAVAHYGHRSRVILDARCASHGMHWVHRDNWMPLVADTRGHMVECGADDGRVQEFSVESPKP